MDLLPKLEVSEEKVYVIFDKMNHDQTQMNIKSIVYSASEKYIVTNLNIFQNHRCINHFLFSSTLFAFYFYLFKLMKYKIFSILNSNSIFFLFLSPLISSNIQKSNQLFEKDSRYQKIECEF